MLDGARKCAELSRMFRLIMLLTKGVLRDTRLRRNVMMWVMLAAMLMLFLGSWLIADEWARQHPWLYLFYWLACAWLTLTGVMLALFDILIIRATARIMRRKLEQDIAHIDEQTKPKGEGK